MSPPPTLRIEFLLLILYGNLYMGLRNFVLVHWMKRVCPVSDPSLKAACLESSNEGLQYTLSLRRKKNHL